MLNTRPRGVTILALLQFLGGALSLMFGIVSLFFGGLMVVSQAAETAGTGAQIPPIMIAVGILAILSGILGLLAGYGLFTLKGWGWLLAMWFSVLNIVHNVIAMFQGANIPGPIVGIVISGLILYYLNQLNVKRAFGRA